MASDVRRPLVAGNWKMNGLMASVAELGKIVAGAASIWRARPICWSARRRRWLPPLPWPRAARRCALAARIATAEAIRRLHRRHLGGDAEGRRRDRRHRRPFRAARPSRGERCGRARPRRSAAFRAGLTAIVCVGETESRARGRRDPREDRTAVRGLAARQGRRGKSGRRLRAGLGDRHRTDADTGRCRGGSRISPQAPRHRATRRSGADDPHPLWRLGQARQCRGTDGRRQCRWRAGRRRQPEGGGIPCHCLGLAAEPIEGGIPQRDRVDTPANSYMNGCRQRLVSAALRQD